MNWSWTVARIRGIPVRINVTLLILLPYVTYVATNLFHSEYQELVRVLGLDAGPLLLPPLAWGAILALSLFVAVLLHELAHCLTAMAAGARVESITLMMLGGVSRIVDEIRSPGREAWMAASGPLTSLALAVLFYVVARLLESGPADLTIAAGVFAEINLVLAIFNLLPAFPMDGGRILRAALTPRYGRLAATRKAAAVGKVMAVLFGILGLVTFNFILILIAVFVFMGASAETTALAARVSLRGLRMRSLVDRRIGQVRPDVPLAVVAERFLEDDLVAVRVGDGLTGPGAGFITLDDLERMGRGQAGARAGDVARRDLPRARAEDDAAAILSLLQRGRGAVLVVDEAGEPMGLVSAADVRRAALLAHVLEETGRGRA